MEELRLERYLITVLPLGEPLVVQTVTAGACLNLRDVGNLEPTLHELGLKNRGSHTLQLSAELLSCVLLEE